MNLILIVDTVQFYRDVFRSRLLEELLADESSRITLYCTFNLEATQKEFQHERVRIVALKRKKPTWFSSFLFSWAKDLWTVEQPESSFTQKRMVEALANKRKNLHFRLGIARMAMKMGITSQGIIRFMENFGHDAEFDRLIREAFSLLGLITYITTGEIETRAWTIAKGTPAAAAAGKIHTDIEKGFIRAEVVSFDDMIRYQGRVGAREAGKARSEGRDYIVQDGDVILFFHN